MPYIFQAEEYCDECGERLRRELLATATSKDKRRFKNETQYDSAEFPKAADADEPSDSPSHCAARAECCNAVELVDGTRVGQLLSLDLTEAGIDYTRAEIEEDWNAVTAYWADVFSSYFAPPNDIFDITTIVQLPTAKLQTFAMSPLLRQAMSVEESWTNARQYVEEHAILVSNLDIRGMEVYVNHYGGWRATHFLSWSRKDCDALILQLVADKLLTFRQYQRSGELRLIETFMQRVFERDTTGKLLFDLATCHPDFSF